MTKSEPGFFPALILVLGGLELIGVAAACYGYFAAGSGTSFTEGAFLVIVSSLLILGATLITGFMRDLAHGLRVTLNILLFLGFAGTIFAAWLLMNWVLLWAMIAALVVWFVILLIPQKGPPRRLAH